MRLTVSSILMGMDYVGVKQFYFSADDMQDKKIPQAT